jgi:hypothetical protein
MQFHLRAWGPQQGGKRLYFEAGEIAMAHINFLSLSLKTYYDTKFSACGMIHLIRSI